MPQRAKIFSRTAFVGLLTFVGAGLASAPAFADAQLLLEADSGKVLHAENANYPWYPASTTKLMTLYVSLQAVKQGRIKLDSLITVSPKAAAQPPSKMGIKAGLQVTLDNALKMLMVRSANDMAVTIAEGVSGSVENFSAEMNSVAYRLGMVQSHFVNPHGLPDENHISSARDMGILARALIHDMAQYEFYWRIPGIKFGNRVTRNYNKLMDRYPGADGMKTGYICASGFNLVATATRNRRKLIAVVFGAPSSAVRAVKAAQLLERGFNGGALSWLRPSLGTVDALTPIAAAPPNLREEFCGKHRRKPASEDEDDDDTPVAANGENNEQSVMLSSLRAPEKPFTLAGLPAHLAPPVEVFVGPAKRPGQVPSGAVAGAKPVPVKPLQAGQTAGLSAVPTVAAAGEWSSLTPTPLAHTPPASMNSILAEPAATVPMPRPRPKVAISPMKGAKVQPAAPAKRAKVARPAARAKGAQTAAAAAPASASASSSSRSE